ncbi:MAG: type II toxin-antitoxin system HicB family antitoxin [Cyanobacteria bacterium K_DeepCast_150m_m2_101]|nr:type II toxin-antitoxin system HicB family antitoxin [Cyanobacteria bacterium K_DeepCast_150m_m2_101]
MKGELTAVIEPAEEGGYWAVCIEVPGANGQGDTPAEAKASLLEAVQLILQDRQDDILRSLPSDAVCEPLLVG